MTAKNAEGPELIDMTTPSEDYAASRGGIDPRVAAVEKDVSRVEIRVTALEMWQRAVEIDQAKRTERDIAIKEKLDRIDSTMTWLNRIVIGAVVSAILLVALKGGFNNLPL